MARRTSVGASQPAVTLSPTSTPTALGVSGHFLFRTRTTSPARCCHRAAVGTHRVMAECARSCSGRPGSPPRREPLHSKQKKASVEDHRLTAAGFLTSVVPAQSAEAGRVGRREEVSARRARHADRSRQGELRAPNAHLRVFEFPATDGLPAGPPVDRFHASCRAAASHPRDCRCAIPWVRGGHPAGSGSGRQRDD